jgi:hypothetical protein
MIDSTGLIPSWKSANRSATQEFPNILWNPKVHYRVHKSTPLVRISARSMQSISPQLLGLRSGLFPSGFPTNIIYAFLLLLIRATCPAPLPFLHLIILTILGEEYKLWSYSLCSFRQPPVTSSLFGPNIVLSALFCRQNCVNWSLLLTKAMHKKGTCISSLELQITDPIRNLLHTLFSTSGSNQMHIRDFASVWLATQLMS